MREFACVTKASNDYEKSLQELDNFRTDQLIIAENRILLLERANALLKIEIANALGFVEDVDKSRYVIEQELLAANEDEIIPIIDENDFDYYKTKKGVE
jgi:hypothetical protein